jgi:hypothetical protein
LPPSGFEFDFELKSLERREVFDLGDFNGSLYEGSIDCDACRSVKGFVYWLSGELACESASLEEIFTPEAF